MGMISITGRSPARITGHPRIRIEPPLLVT
jgi:hypothetical protein